MSKLEKLIQQYCPDGVEYVRLGDILSVNRGKRLTKTQLSDDGKYYVYHGSKDTPLGKYSQFNVKGNTTIVVNTGGIGGVKYCNEDFWCSDGSFWIGHSALLNDKYVYYYLSPKENYFASQKRVGGVPTIDRSTVENVEISVPPLPVQEEIVRVLDAFTELQAELQAELQKRKQQYNFYRDNLLTNYTSEQNVKEYCLGELFEFKNGLNASKEQFGHGKPIVNYVNVYKKNSIVSSDLTGRVELEASAIERYRVKRGDVFFTRTSETREEVGFASVLLENIEDCVFSGFVLRARPTTNFILPEFCKYCFATYKIRKQIIQSSTLTTRALTNGTSLSKVKIMIPPIEEQNRIVSILDRFDTLTNDLTSGLPAEMEKRRQQYEFYRDKLLTFKRKEA